MRILLADSQSRVRFALRVLLDRQPDTKVAGEAEDAQGLLAQAKTTSPDLVLLGWELPGMAPADLLLALHQVAPQAHVIALSGRPEARRVALDAGVDAFVSKTGPPENLLAAIDQWRSASPNRVETRTNAELDCSNR